MLNYDSPLNSSFQKGRELSRVNFRKDVWDCYLRQGKNWPTAEWPGTSKDLRNNCGTHSAFVYIGMKKTPAEIQNQ